MLSDEAIEAESKDNYDYISLSEILSHESFRRLMLDITVYVFHSHMPSQWFRTTLHSPMPGRCFYYTTMALIYRKPVPWSCRRR